MSLSTEQVCKAVTVLAAAGYGNTPRALTEGTDEDAAQVVLVWRMALRQIEATDAELGQAVQALLVQSGRRFWPSTSEVADAIRAQRRQTAREDHRRTLAAQADAHELPTPEDVRTEDQRRAFVLARMRRAGIESGLRQIRILEQLGQSTRVERAAVAEFEEELREMADADEEAEA